MRAFGWDDGIMLAALVGDSGGSPANSPLTRDPGLEYRVLRLYLCGELLRRGGEDCLVCGQRKAHGIIHAG